MAAALLIASLTAGCGSQTPAAGAAVSGGSGSQRDLLRELVDRLQPTRINAIRIRDRNPNGAGTSLDIEFVNNRLSFLDSWQAALLTEAFVERSVDDHLPRVRWYSTSNGEGTAIGYPQNTPTRPLPATTADQIRLANTARRLVASRGATIRTLRILRPYGTDILLSIQPRNPASFLRSQTQSLLDKLGFWTSYGVYLRISDTRGHVIYEAWSAFQHDGRRIAQDGPLGKYKHLFSLPFP